MTTEDSQPDIAERADGGSRAYPNLRHIRLLDYAASLGSLSRAAEAVRISQPAASQAISRLEELYGGALLERRGGGVLVTERGSLVVARARRALDLLREATARLGRQQRTAKRPAGDLLETHATIAHLRALAGFAAAGSFSGAARRVQQAEPSVQRAAREVERICGVPLFSGRQQGIRLTPAGAALASAGSLVLRELESAIEEVRELDGSFDGRVVIGTLPSVRTRVVPDAVAMLTRAHPRAWIEIVDGPYQTLLNSLLIGGMDVLVGALRSDTTAKGIGEETLYHDDLSVVARSGHPLIAQRKVTFADLGGYSWILPREGTPTRSIFERMVRDHQIRLPDTGVIETGSLVALRGILLETDRLTLISRRQIAYEEMTGLLGVVPLQLPGTERAIGITIRRGWKPTKLQAELIDQLRKAAKRAH